MAVMDVDPSIDQQFSTPSYELDEQEVLALSKDLLSELRAEGLDATHRFACAEFGSESRYANLARVVEGAVFNEAFNNTPEIMSEEYGPYEGASRFWVLLDTEKQMPIGALRVIQNSPNGLKTLNDIKGEPLNFSLDDICQAHGIDSETTWDVGTVAILPEYRGAEFSFLPSLSLYRALYARSVELGVKNYVTILDKKAKANLDLLGVPFKPILGSEGFSYLGSDESYALYADVPELAPGVERKKHQVEGGDGLKKLIYQSCDILLNGTSVDEARFVLTK